MTSTTTYDVIGMTCAHCVQAVTDEVSAIRGVRDVDIELVAGGTSTVRVVSEEPLAADDRARRPSTRRATSWSVRREAGRDARRVRRRAGGGLRRRTRPRRRRRPGRRRAADVRAQGRRPTHADDDDGTPTRRTPPTCGCRTSRPRRRRRRLAARSSADDTLRAGAAVPFRFTVTGPDGSPETDYVRTHTKELHLIVVRRDLASFQHVHPVRGADGTLVGAARPPGRRHATGSSPTSALPASTAT